MLKCWNVERFKMCLAYRLGTLAGGRQFRLFQMERQHSWRCAICLAYRFAICLAYRLWTLAGGRQFRLFQMEQQHNSNLGPHFGCFFERSPLYKGDNSNWGPHFGPHLCCFFERSPLYKGDRSNLGPYWPGFVYELRGWSWLFFRSGCATFEAALIVWKLVVLRTLLLEGHILGRICVVFLSGPLCTKGTAQIWGRIGLDLFTSSAVGHGCSLEVAVQHLEPRLSFGLFFWAVPFVQRGPLKFGTPFGLFFWAVPFVQRGQLKFGAVWAWICLRAPRLVMVFLQRWLCNIWSRACGSG